MVGLWMVGLPLGCGEATAAPHPSFAPAANVWLGRGVGRGLHAFFFRLCVPHHHHHHHDVATPPTHTQHNQAQAHFFHPTPSNHGCG